jgi:hypothetical protein
MPASFLAEMILQPIFEAVFHLGGYYIGRLVVPVISFGRWKCAPLLSDVPKRRRKRRGTCHERGQQVCLTSEATACIGVLFVLLLAGLVFLLWYLKKH